MSYRNPVDSSASWEDSSLREWFNIPYKLLNNYLVTHLKAHFSVTTMNVSVPAVILIGECICMSFMVINCRPNM